MKINPRITLERIEACLLRDEDAGFCTECGAKAHCVEPDARNYRCEDCGELAVFGAEELLFHIEC